MPAGCSVSRGYPRAPASCVSGEQSEKLFLDRLPRPALLSLSPLPQLLRLLLRRLPLLLLSLALMESLRQEELHSRGVQGVATTQDRLCEEGTAAAT